jgi:hypothetical protein
MIRHIVPNGDELFQRPAAQESQAPHETGPLQPLKHTVKQGSPFVGIGQKSTDSAQGPRDRTFRKTASMRPA